MFWWTHASTLGYGALLLIPFEKLTHQDFTMQEAGSEGLGTYISVCMRRGRRLIHQRRLYFAHFERIELHIGCANFLQVWEYGQSRLWKLRF